LPLLKQAIVGSSRVGDDYNVLLVVYVFSLTA
jgi:hypothetical protein